MRIDVLDHGYLSLIETWGSEEAIIEAARMSTAKGFLGWGVPETCATCKGSGTNEPENGPGSLCKDCCGRRERINKPGDEKLLRFLYENHHDTPFEMAGATFEVQAPIFVFREWHRHRIPFGYNEMSARYTPLPDVNYIPTVERLMINSKTNKQAGVVAGAAELTEKHAEDFRHELADSYQAAESLYQAALKAGVPKELARVHLPVGRYSRMRATGNLRGWLAFLRLREAPGAQYEIRMYAHALHALLKEKFPRTIGLFEERA
jgi:thymidylate synthase (FAD)